MEITLEQVERLREKADVSYARAKQALEYSGGNLLDALIYLEEQGDIPRPEGACYSTRSQTPPPPREEPEEAEPRKRAGKWKKAERGGVLQRLRFLLLDNELEIWRRDSPVTAIPVLILILLLIVAYYIVLPLLILGLFLGFRYRFSGPDLERESINNVMGSVADTAADLGRQVMDSWSGRPPSWSAGWRRSCWAGSGTGTTPDETDVKNGRNRRCQSGFCWWRTRKSWPAWWSWS